MNFVEASHAVRQLGFELKLPVEGEYRILDMRKPEEKRERGAYWSDDLEDIVSTAKAWRDGSYIHAVILPGKSVEILS